LKGVQVGDLGSKLGYSSKDNGWLILENVRIPRDNMLDRFAHVDKDGQIEIRGNTKAVYSTMVNIRS
jgi:acyl-CoA oxidase